MNVLKKALKVIDDFYGGSLEFEGVDDPVQEFLFHIQLFSHKDGTFKEDRKHILEVQLTLKALEDELKKPWNQERVCRKIGESTSSSATTSRPLDVKIGCKTSEDELKKSQNEERAGKKIGESRSLNCTASKNPTNLTTADDEIGCSNSEGKKRGAETMEAAELVVTPIATKRIKFARVTPKVDMLPTFKCNTCPKKFVWLKALRRHMKMQHGIDEADEALKDLKEVEDRVTCRLCKCKVSRDLLTRHLKTKHKIEKAGSKAIFRGFLTVNGVQWQPLWLDKNEEDPPKEIMVPIDDSGRITIYGVQFEVEEMETTELDGKEVGHGREKNKKAEDEEKEPADIEVMKSKKSTSAQLQPGTLNEKEKKKKAEDEEKEPGLADLENASSSALFVEATSLYDMEDALMNDNFHLSPTFNKTINRDSWFESRCKSRDTVIEPESDKAEDEVLNDNGNESEPLIVDGHKTATNAEEPAREQKEKDEEQNDKLVASPTYLDNGCKSTEQLDDTGNEVESGQEMDEDLVGGGDTVNGSEVETVEEKEVETVEEGEVETVEGIEVETVGGSEVGTDQASEVETVQGSEVQKINLAFEVQDEFCLHDDYGSATNEGAEVEHTEGNEEVNVTSDFTEPLPKLRVEVFTVLVENGEFWSAEDGEWETDCDFEYGDDKNFTEARLEMKRLRFAYFTH